MKPIRFTFDQKKFQELLVLLSERVKDLDRLKAVKLLYFVDRECLTTLAHPVLGDVYFRMDYGPVPSQAYDLMKQISDATPEWGVVEQLQSGLRYPVYHPVRSPDFSVFSDAEVSCIERVIEQYGQLSGLRLSDIAHEQRAWKDTAENAPIDYMLFFQDPTGKDREVIEVLMSDQEDRDFLSDL